jgi:hypothetical protein
MLFWVLHTHCSHTSECHLYLLCLCIDDTNVVHISRDVNETGEEIFATDVGCG